VKYTTHFTSHRTISDGIVFTFHGINRAEKDTGISWGKDRGREKIGSISLIG